MTRSNPDDAATTRLDRDADASGTTAGADVTSRMAGTTPTDDDAPRADDGHTAQHAAPTGSDDHDHDHDHTGTVLDTSRPADRARGVVPAKTSAAATFALVFGLAALFCALTGILAPVAVVLGLIGLILGISGRKMSRRPGVTGSAVAAGGLVTAILGLVLGLAVIAGAAVYVNQQGLDNLQEQIDNARDKLPTGQDIVEQVPGS